MIEPRKTIRAASSLREKHGHTIAPPPPNFTDAGRCRSPGIRPYPHLVIALPRCNVIRHSTRFSLYNRPMSTLLTRSETSFLIDLRGLWVAARPWNTPPACYSTWSGSWCSLEFLCYGLNRCLSITLHDPSNCVSLQKRSACTLSYCRCSFMFPLHYFITTTGPMDV